MPLIIYRCVPEDPYNVRVNNSLTIGLDKAIIHAANNAAQREGHVGWTIPERTSL